MKQDGREIWLPHVLRQVENITLLMETIVTEMWATNTRVWQQSSQHISKQDR